LDTLEDLLSSAVTNLAQHMIINVINGDILQTPLKHIAFAANTSGYHDSGFSGVIAQKFVPQIANTGKRKMGEVISFTSGDRIFHGLVCHSLEKDGWIGAPGAIEKCLNRIDVTDNEPVAIVLMGGSIIGKMSGVDVVANIKAIHQSKRNCVIYCLEYSPQEIWSVIEV
jgi:hypothetical protein